MAEHKFAEGQRVTATIYGEVRHGTITLCQSSGKGIVWVLWDGKKNPTWQHAESLTPFPPPSPDVSVENHGSLFLFRPLTDAGREWIDQHVQDDAQWFGPALVVEHRYARDLAEGMAGDGLVLE